MRANRDSFSPLAPAFRRNSGASGVIRVQTNLVNILVSVIDANGEPVPDLTQDAFDLSEEGVPQKIERFEAQTNRPLDLALMVDSSMSTFKDVKIRNRRRRAFHPAGGAARRHAGRVRICRTRDASWRIFPATFRSLQSAAEANMFRAAALRCTTRWCSARTR